MRIFLDLFLPLRDTHRKACRRAEKTGAGGNKQKDGRDAGSREER
jgi:hypothetical protein